MLRMALLAVLTASPAFAHDGFHPHPHGIVFGWIAACVLCLVLGAVLGRYWGTR